MCNVRKEYVIFMYEHLRNEIMMKLSANFSAMQVDMICSTLDDVISHYEVKEKCTEITVYNETFPQLAEIYLQSKRLEGISEKTEKLYRNRLVIFFNAVQMQPEKVTTNDIRRFLATYKMQSNISDRTLDKFRQIINCFFVWCMEEEYIVKNPCKNIKEIKYQVVPRKALTRMELEKLRRACKTKRELAIVDTLYSTGCRVAELSNMKKSDVNRDDKSIHIIGKGKKYNICYFNTNAQISVNEYLNSRKDDNEYLFVMSRSPFAKLSTTAIEGIFRTLSKRTGLKVTPHIMRHTSATLALQNGMPLPQVQKMLGHANSTTTMIYAEVLQDDIRNSHMKYVI